MYVEPGGNARAVTQMTQEQKNAVKAIRLGSDTTVIDGLLDIGSSVRNWFTARTDLIFPNATDLSVNQNIGRTNAEQYPYSFYLYDSKLSAITFMASTAIENVEINTLKKITALSDLSACGGSTSGGSVFNNCSELTSIELPSSGTFKVFSFTGDNEESNARLFNRNTYGVASLTIPAGLNLDLCRSCFGYTLTDVTFEGRTMAEVQKISGYPFGINGYETVGGVIHCSDGDLEPDSYDDSDGGEESS